MMTKRWPRSVRSIVKNEITKLYIFIANGYCYCPHPKDVEGKVSVFPHPRRGYPISIPLLLHWSHVLSGGTTSHNTQVLSGGVAPLVGDTPVSGKGGGCYSSPKWGYPFQGGGGGSLSPIQVIPHSQVGEYPRVFQLGQDWGTPQPGQHGVPPRQNKRERVLGMWWAVCLLLESACHNCN